MKFSLVALCVAMTSANKMNFDDVDGLAESRAMTTAAATAAL